MQVYASSLHSVADCQVSMPQGEGCLIPELALEDFLDLKFK